jgi:hypothetical protein
MKKYPRKFKRGSNTKLMIGPKAKILIKMGKWLSKNKTMRKS